MLGVQLSPDARRVFDELEERGLLLMQDPGLPDLVGAIVGTPLSGSWWSHPANGAIFRVLNELAAHPDVFLAPLVNRKRTFVHRAHWPALVCIGAAREAWQLRPLEKAALELLASVDASGVVVASGDAVKRLERALLIAAEEVHTSSGRHAKRLIAWRQFAEERIVSLRGLSPEAAKQQLEQAAARLAEGRDAKVRLPWQ